MIEILQAKNIKPRLESLIAEAEIVNYALATRLRQIKTWIKNTEPGSLTKKRELMFFLRELIEDVEIWLALTELDPIERQEALKEFNATEKYWFTKLFPKWFNTYDPKFSTWKKKLMAGEFEAKDRQVLNILADMIKRRGGSILLRYICDLSMATDLIVCDIYDKPLCIQLTITNNNLLDSKKNDWLDTVKLWGIQRAFFLTYSPISKTESQLQVILRLCNYIIEKSNSLPESCYIIDSIN